MKQPIDLTPAKPGCPYGYTPAVRDLLCALIRIKGLSDSAAAREACVSTSSLSRWKRENPELPLALHQAREEFRMARLDTILQAANAEDGRGWRAAAWLLTHIFPEDYSPKAAEREKFQQLALAREQEEEAALTESENAPTSVAVNQNESAREVESPRIAFESDSQNSCAREARVSAGASPAGAIRRFSTADRANCVAVRRGGEQAWSRTGRSQYT